MPRAQQKDPGKTARAFRKTFSPQSTILEQLAAELKVWLLDPTGEAAKDEILALGGKRQS